MAARQFGGVVPASLDQWPESSEDAADVLAFQGQTEEAVGVVEHEVDFRFQGQRFRVHAVHGGVRGADQHFAQPRDGKQDAAIVGLGDEQGIAALQDLGIEDEVDALAGSEPVLVRRIVEPTEGIAVGAARIDHDVAVEGKRFAGQRVAQVHAVDVSI